MIINIRLPYLISILGLFLLSIFFNLSFWLNSYQFGVMDVQKITQIEAQKLASLYPKGNVPVERLQALADTIKENIQSSVQNKNLILFAKGAVLSSNLKDYTGVLVESLKDEQE